MKPVEIIIYLHQTFGLGGLVVGLLILGICILIYEVTKHYLLKYLEYKFPYFNKRKKVEQSSFFDKMSVLVYYKITRLKISCPLRKAIFKKILRLCFETWRERAREKVTDTKLDHLNTEEYINFWRNFIYKTTDVWEDKAIAEGIPEVAIEKYRDKHSKTLQLCVTMVEQISGSVVIYTSNTEKTLAILDFIAIVLDMALLDAEQTIMELNGELSKVTFNEIACSSCEANCVLHSESEK